MDDGLFIISVSMQLRIFAGPFLFLPSKILEIILLKHYKATYYSPLLSENDGKYNIDAIFSIFCLPKQARILYFPLKITEDMVFMQSLAFFPYPKIFSILLQ